MKRALLVNPWIYDFKCHDFWIKPYGLLRIATLLKNNGFEVDLIDCMDRYDPDMSQYKAKDKSFGRGDFYSEELAKPDPYKKVPRKYKRYGLTADVFKKKLEAIQRPDIILVSSGVSYSYEGVFLAIDLIIDRFPSVKLVLGGIYATLCIGHAQKHSKANLVWQGDVNNNFIRILNQFTGTKIEQTTDIKLKELVPDYSFYPDTPYAAVKFTAGCPFNCTYCAIKQLCEGYYQRNTDNIIKELEGYKARGIQNIAFYDDALLYKNYFIKGVLKEIIKRGLKFVFHASNGLHAAYIDEETATLMKSAGFVEPRVSLETTDYELQKKTGSKVTCETFEKAIKNLKKAGFKNNDIGVYILEIGRAHV